ncbi:MAG: hypothetical protein EAY66_03280 [Sphingobacteriales bacterium]|jgi:hypothetical protein|nr:MAG: hypothetical protein EAY66_03280 [Sphingobacteriales bacterium]
MKKFHILIIVLFGYLLLPSSTFACETKSVKACCKKEISAQATKKNCCSHKIKSKKNACNGKCGHSGCTTTAQFSIAIINQTTINTAFNLSAQRQNFYPIKTNISAGFYTLWLIPKIS